mmetsp:Transcript_12230/g.25785  ORF Transcript_12230/g.25785 Transcript_12230/m.25785 type:complete len:102 (-) Transcript_12230:69-374(-)
MVMITILGYQDLYERDTLSRAKPSRIFRREIGTNKTPSRLPELEFDGVYSATDLFSLSCIRTTLKTEQLHDTIMEWLGCEHNHPILVDYEYAIAIAIVACP